MSEKKFGVGALNPHITREFTGLKQRGKVLAEYIWIGGSGEDIRCKTMVLDGAPATPEDLREWNYDGSSTGQAPGHDSEVLIRPVAIFADPFRGGDNILVMCSTYRPNGEPVSDLPHEGGLGGNNNRALAEAVFNHPKVCVRMRESTWVCIWWGFCFVFVEGGIAVVGSKKDKTRWEKHTPLASPHPIAFRWPTRSKNKHPGMALSKNTRCTTWTR